MIANISYKNYKKSSDIHGTALYPAVMVAPMQKEILRKLIEPNKTINIFDPFHGSGTSLYESIEISKDVQLFGCDINPLANLITKVKLQGITENILTDIDTLEDLILDDNTSNNNHSFNNINKWFRQDIIESLSIIRRSIMQIDDSKNRLYFWYIMSDIIRKYSNTRSSTYKLHIKPLFSIANIQNNVISDYLDSVKRNISMFGCSYDNFKLYKSDILDKIEDFEDNSFDISITSPPYGDNATTVPYGQFSMLPLHWIDSKDLELEGWELDNYSKIDNASLGGKKRIANFNKFELDLLKPYLEQISHSKKQKVINFFDDYFYFLKELCRVTNEYIVMTLGNRTVDGITINLTDITKKYIENERFANIDYGQRQIPNKRIPSKTSKVNKKPVKSITHEYVIIHKREK
ncbi:hypothetical protein RBU61_02915 [Tissierella sp. MB52-C2]|uniref:hypothetical protein n=1 Tax=Tissierella sp. MB52-C2 TaxID=3070999 RepID=UPI00280C36CB|nr:hypothetical protein [Tissierella sp. MB52-C2]WMM25635.1 hypothetical protein RBU61_02915 [Tissierella sp. MB52-C2]